MNQLTRKGFTVEVDLGKYGYKSYSVECTYQYDKKEGNYLLRMGLKPKHFGSRIKIEFNEIDTQYISGMRENIERRIKKLIDFAASSNFFDEHIKQFEYECKCFDIGNEILEKERLSKNDNEE